MKVKFKKLNPEAVIPKHAKEGDAGLDLVAISREETGAGFYIYDTGIAVEIPDGHFGMMVPRSSSYKTGQRLLNGTGIIDSGYRGPLKAMYSCASFGVEPMQAGDRVVQLVIVPYVTVESVEVNELSDTSRGDGGFGSTGK